MKKNLCEKNKMKCETITFFYLNPGPAEPVYALPLQTVQIQISWPTDLFVIKYVNLYQQPGSRNLTG